MAFGGDVEVVSSSSPTLSCSEGGWRRSLAIQGLSKRNFWLWIGDGTTVEHHTRKESSGCQSLEKSFRPARGRPSSSWHWCRQGGSPLCSSPPWTAFSRRERTSTMFVINPRIETRSSWLNCALRDEEAVYWVSIGHYKAVAVGTWWYWVSRGHLCLYILNKVEIWTGVTDAWLTDWQTDNFEK